MTAFLAIIRLASIGLILGVGLGIAAKKFGVAVDRREEEVLNLLPGANCGACALPGCQAYASAVVSAKAPVNACVAGGNELSLKLAEIMGAEVEESVPQVAVVCCRGGNNVVDEKFIYRGVNDCLAASLLQGGGKKCPYGCLGFGTCVSACPFGALKMGRMVCLSWMKGNAQDAGCVRKHVQEASFRLFRESKKSTSHAFQEVEPRM